MARTRTEEIPQRDWVEYLDEFSRGHQGEQVTVEVMSKEVGAQVEARDVPLQGISADRKRSGEHDVNIILGKELNPPLTHIVPEARRIFVMSSDQGTDQALEIEAADGSRTLVRFELPAAA
jgi:hypothetical protein